MTSTSSSRASSPLHLPPWTDGSLLDALPIVLVRVDREGQLVSLTRSWETLSGFAVAESLGRPYLSFVDASDHAACRASEAYLYAGGAGPASGKLRLVRRDGALRVVEVRFFAMGDVDGAPEGMGGTVTDVTGVRHEPHHQLEALRLSAGRTRLLIERAAFGVFGCAPNGRLLDANPALAAMLGYPDTSAILEANVFDVLCPPGAIRDRCLGELAAGAPESSYDVTCRRPDGTSLRLRLTVTAERDATGAIRHLQGMAENITERMRREEIVRRGERMSSLGRTLAGVAHEINNPLAAITGFAQILLKRDQSADDRHAVETMLHEARRAARIVKDLLTIARREEGAERTRTDLNAIVRYIVETQRYAMETRDIRPVVQLAEERPEVMGDPAQLEQVILNLVVNARQALEAPPGIRTDQGPPRTLEVSTRVAGADLLLEVADNGRGIDARELPHIWDPFFTTREEGEGTGLGLSVVHSIVASHGGTIDVTSTPGEGTRFRIRLPLAPRAAPPAGASRRRAAGPRVATRPLDILVVDDEAVIRELLSRYFTTRGHAVVAAVNGEHALRLAESGTFDVIISDLRMPGMDGRALIRRLRELPSCANTRFVLSTGDTAAAPTGADDALADVAVVNKPYDVDALVDLVEGR
jgi:PAS domain S-box-containing protein